MGAPGVSLLGGSATGEGGDFAALDELDELDELDDPDDTAIGDPATTASCAGIALGELEDPAVGAATTAAEGAGIEFDEADDPSLDVICRTCITGPASPYFECFQFAWHGFLKHT